MTILIRKLTPSKIKAERARLLKRAQVKSVPELRRKVQRFQIVSF